MKKYLIINADDLGLTKSVTEGIFYAHRFGIVTSSTVMMNRTLTYDAIIESKMYPSLGVGVHLVFNKDTPLSPIAQVSSLLNNEGSFIRDVYLERMKIDVKELKSEFILQINRFIDIKEELPTHLDCHHWNILYPPFLKVLIEIANLFQIPIRNPLMDYSVMTSSELQQLLGLIPINDVFESMDVNKSLLMESNISCPSYFRADFFGRKINLYNIKNILLELKNGINEVMTHPGFVDNDLIKSSSYVKERFREINTLTSPELRDFIKEKNIELVDFRYFRHHFVKKA